MRTGARPAKTKYQIWKNVTSSWGKGGIKFCLLSVPGLNASETLYKGKKLPTKTLLEKNISQTCLDRAVECFIFGFEPNPLAMNKIFTLFLSACFALNLSAHKTDPVAVNPYEAYFNKAYALYPEIPRGTLEAVAYTNTRFTHLEHDGTETESCVGVPNAYGVMGLTLDGKNYFHDNLKKVAKLSGSTAEEIISSPEKNILAYAKAFHASWALSSPYQQNENMIARVLGMLSELPSGTELQAFALNTQLYGIFTFMNDPMMQSLYKFPAHHFDLPSLFGEENYKILSSGRVIINGNTISDGKGNTFKGGNSSVQSADYAPALWVASPNFNSRGGQAVSAVTIHTVQGSYAGCISWFQNTSSGVSAHYVVRSSDGQITQMVLEANRAWHVGSENGYTVGIEHEGYVTQASWYTVNMYTESAALVADICASHGIDPERTLFQPWGSTTYYNQSGIPGSCTKVKGHQHNPNQSHTDPGPNWDWNYFYKLINDPAPGATVYTTTSGNLFDSGGSGANYSNDERTLWTIAPPGATNVTLTFNSFALENTWDYLYVYDGPNVWSTLIGYYTGSTNPGTLIASSGTLTLEFRSDCATTGTGWDASWNSNATTITPANLSITTASCPQDSVTLKWTNSGSSWFVDVTDDPTWTSFYNKAVPNLTQIGCPGGFANNLVPTEYLAFKPNTTYYWRIWDGSSHTVGNSFMTPSCMYQDTNCAGSFYDTGGPTGNYMGNEDYVSIFAPSNATSVTMNFTAFTTEANFDSMWVYNGPTELDPLIGIYTGSTNPGTIIANSGAMTIRFKADPFVNMAGWAATWNCTQGTTGVNSQSAVSSLAAYPNPFNENIKVNYFLNGNASIKISLIDVIGREIILLQEEQSGGKHQMHIDTKELSLNKGVYFLKLESEGKSSFVKLVKN